MRYAESDVERFWKYVDRKSADICWEWNGSLNGHGYGQLRLLKKNISAHRFSYMIAKGPIRKGKVIRHQCNNRRCVNPSHLLAGWHEDNTADIVRAGLKRRVLTDVEREKVRFMHAEGKSRHEISQTLRCGFYIVAGFMEREGMKALRLGRPKGSKNQRQRFSDEAKRQIVSDYRSGLTQQSVAEKHGCDQTYVSLLVKRSAPCTYSNNT